MQLSRLRSPLLDVGAGSGTISTRCTRITDLRAVYTEPTASAAVCCDEMLCLIHALPRAGAHVFRVGAVSNSAIIGWVLHHDAPDVPADAILGEICGSASPSGRLISIEPLPGDFDAQKWRSLVK